MPRYETGTQFRNQFFDTLGGDIQQGLSRNFEAQRQDKKSQKAVENAIRKSVAEAILSGKGRFPEESGVDLNTILGGGDLDLSQYDVIPQGTTTTTSTPRSTADIVSSQNILGALTDPKRTYKNEDTRGLVDRTGGFFGIGSDYAFKPGVEDTLRKQANTVLSGPKVTSKTTSKGAFNGKALGQATQAINEDTSGSDIPDASLYQEGTEANINGIPHKVEGGEWVPLR